jgi:ATP-dependent DNA helicase RecG
MRYDIKFVDENGNEGFISIFNSAFLASKLVEKSWFIIIGKPQLRAGKIVFSHPDVVPATSPTDDVASTGSPTTHNTGRIFPIYSEMQGIKPGRFAQKIWDNLGRIPDYFAEYLPEEFTANFHLLDVVNSIKNLHYPENEEMRNKALYRMLFDRLLRIQLFSLMNKLEYQGTLETPELLETPHWEILKPMLDQISFTLTVAQKKVIVQILEDMHRGKSMLRLLQ